MERTSADLLRDHHETMCRYYIARDLGRETEATALLASATSLYTAYDWQLMTEWLFGLSPTHQ